MYRIPSIVFSLSLLPLLWLRRTSPLLFSDLPPSLSSRRTMKSSTKLGVGGDGAKPILVVGATGQVGRRVVQQLLEQNVPVRALVRNIEKAAEIFGEQMKSMDLVVADLGKYDRYENELDAAVKGCGSVISVSGAMRFSKLLDFLPWRLLNDNVSDWSGDTSHPYYANYKAQCYLIDLAKRHDVGRFVRLTGLSSGFSPFALFSMLFSSLLSMTGRYHFLTEQYLRRSGVPYVILRPGGLTNDARDSAKTYLQVDPSGSLPPPARVPRDDVAALAVASCTLAPRTNSYTLAIRAVGEVAPKPQGSKEDGYATAEECFQKQVLGVSTASDMSEKLIMTIDDARKRSRSYGVAVTLFVYSFSVISLALTYTILSKLGGLLFLR